MTLVQGHKVIEERMVENPLTTDALVAEALMRGAAQPRWEERLVNQVTLAGGLARMKGLTRQQLAAGVRWRLLFDMSLIGGARATDYAAVRVDVSGSGHDVAMDGAAARRELQIARRAIGPFHAGLLDRIVCEEKSVREVARAAGESGGNGRMLTTRRVRDALDALVTHFARGGRRMRRDGEVADDWSVSEAGAQADEPH